MIEVFFYGLFMDSAVLRGKGVSPDNPRVARLDGYALEIGERATLVPARESMVYGLVMRLGSPDIDKLYAEPSVADYRPVTVPVTVTDGSTIDAACYVLPESALSQSPNCKYAIDLFKLAERLGLPSAYLAEIRRFTDAT